MEILALRLFEQESSAPPVTTPIEHLTTTVYRCAQERSRKLDLSDSFSPVPGEDSDALATVYGIVGPSIVSFGLIGNLLILFVVGRSSMTGKAKCLMRNISSRERERETIPPIPSSSCK